MAQKTLTAKVKLDVTSAEQSLTKLERRIKSIEKAVGTGSSAGALEKSVERAILQSDRLRISKAKVAEAEGRVTAQQHRTEAAMLGVLTAESKLTAQTHRTNTAALGTSTAKEKLNTATINTNIAESKLAAQTHKTAKAAIDVTTAEERHRKAITDSATAQARLVTQKHRARKAGFDVLRAEERLTAAEYRTNTAARKFQEILSRSTVNLGKMRGVITKCLGSYGMLVNGASKFNGQISKSSGLLGTMTSKLRMLASTYLGVMGMKAGLSVTDTMISSQNRLNYFSANQMSEGKAYNSNGGYSDKVFQNTQEAMDKMYTSSQKVRRSYTDMMSNVGKFMTLAPDAFQNNTDTAIRFQEIMAEAYAVGGASAAEMSSSMYQLTQALGAGTLAGDELRSVREGAPLAYKAIEEFAQGIYNTDESLKDLAADGKITSDMVVAAIMEDGKKLDKAFAQTEQTFGQTWEQIKNTAQKAFSPIADMLKEKLNEAIDNGLIDKVEQVFNGVSKAIQIAFGIISKAIHWVADNWNWLKGVVVSALITMGIVMLWQAGVAIASFIAQYWMLMLIVSAIFAIVYAIYAWYNAMIDASTAILIIGLAIALVVLLIFGWLPALIIAAVVLVFYFIDYASGAVWWLIMFIVNLMQGILNFLAWVIAGAIWLVINFVRVILNAIFGLVNLILGIGAWCGAMFQNIVVGVINGIIQYLWTLFVEPFIGIIEWILNACNGGFDSFGGAVANLIGQIIGWFLSLGSVVTKIIDAIFGTDWTSGLESLRDKVTDWGKTEEAITIDHNAPELDRISATDAFTTGANTIGYFENTWGDDMLLGSQTLFGEAFESGWSENAWNAGFGVGTFIKDGTNDFFSGLLDDSKDKSDGGIGSLDDLAKKLGINLTDPFNFDNAGVAGAYKDPTIEELLSGIGKDTSNISDSMDLEDDDLEFLRKIAEMEWRKEFTTAEIKVDMTNYNSVTGERDLDGLMSYLSDALKEELTSTANGVHY